MTYPSRAGDKAAPAPPRPGGKGPRGGNGPRPLLADSLLPPAVIFPSVVVSRRYWCARPIPERSSSVSWLDRSALSISSQTVNNASAFGSLREHCEVELTTMLWRTTRGLSTFSISSLERGSASSLDTHGR